MHYPKWWGQFLRSLLLENTQDACVSPPPLQKKSLFSSNCCFPRKATRWQFYTEFDKSGGENGGSAVWMGWWGGGGRRRGAQTQRRNLYLLAASRDSSIVSSVENTAVPSYICCSAFCAFTLLIPTVSNTPPLHCPTLLFYHISRDVIHSHSLPFFADANSVVNGTYEECISCIKKTYYQKCMGWGY